MNLLSVNVARPTSIRIGKDDRDTGIFKMPVDGPVEVTIQGLAGDAVCDTRHHGGVDQAVYVYGQTDYEAWARELGREIVPGTFGENLTISHFESASATIGDRLLIGTVILEVTAPRIPCGTLANRMGDPKFVRRFRDAERPGVYCRVICEGSVRSGMAVEFQRFVGDGIAAIRMFRDYYEGDLDAAALRRYLDAPIAIRDRLNKEQRLAQLDRTIDGT